MVAYSDAQTPFLLHIRNFFKAQKALIFIYFNAQVCKRKV